MKILIVYYSYSHGNTKKIAEALRKATGADIERIETVKKYGPYEETVEVGQTEVQKGYCPPLRPLRKDIEGYDVIALGTPTWWYTMAPAMRTFVTTHDFKGKKLLFFTTHGGWPGSAIKHLTSFTHADEVLGTIEVRFDPYGGDEQITPEKDVDAWISMMEKKVRG